MLKFWKITFVISLGMLSCCRSGGYQEVSIESGIEYMVHYETCLFFTPEVGLLGGEKEGRACCWKTFDGGRNWREQRLAPGRVWDLTERDGVVYATVEKREKDTLLYTHTVYTSCDQGEHWQLKCKMVTKGSMPRLLVLNDQRMFMDVSSGLFETEDGGKNWMLTRKEAARTFIDDKYLYCMFSRLTQDYTVIDYLVRRSLETGEEREVRLPAGIDVRAICGDVVILGKERKLQTYRIEEDMSLTFLSELRQRAFGVDYMGRCGNQLFANLSVSVATEKLLYSPDGGYHWVYMDKSILGEPVYLLTDSSYIRLFLLNIPLYVKSYIQKRISQHPSIKQN